MDFSDFSDFFRFFRIFFRIFLCAWGFYEIKKNLNTGIEGLITPK